MVAPDNAVEIRGLSKVYRGGGGQAPKRALDGVDLEVPRGSMFALLGPNGAGKSTLINILAGLVWKTAGTVRLWGIDIDADARRSRTAIGVVPQELNLDAFFTPRQIVDLQAGMYGIPKRERRTDAILGALGLADKADAYARSLSGGMRRRLLVAKAMVHRPPVLVLDEPTAGVDVELRQQLWDHVRELNREGTTVLLTTHYLEEAETLCDRIAIIDHGRVVCCEPTGTLLGGVDSKAIILDLETPLDTVPAPLAALGGRLTGPSRIRVDYRPSAVPAGAVVAAARDAGLTIRDITTEQADLEDIFLQLTGSGRAATAEADRET